MSLACCILLAIRQGADTGCNPAGAYAQWFKSTQEDRALVTELGIRTGLRNQVLWVRPPPKAQEAVAAKNAATASFFFLRLVDGST